MANTLWTDYGEEQFESNNHLGCVWGLFNSLDYHQWHHTVKKMLHHKKRNGDKRIKRSKILKTRLDAYHSQEADKLLDSEESHFLADQSSPKSSSTHKRSLKARIKAFVSEENYKEKVNKQRRSTLAPRLQRTLSIHHLEPSDDRLDKISNKWTHPIIFLPKNAGSATKFQDLATHKREKCEKESESCVNQLKDYVGVLEIFKVNKDLFQNYIQKTDDGKASKSKAKLTKSGSFPVADLSHFRNLRPSKLKYKQSESWSSRKGDDSPKLVTLNPAKVSLGSTQESDNQESNEGNQENTFSLGPMPSSEENQETRFSLGSMQELENQQSNVENQESDDVSNATLPHFRRTSSLNESLEKYARLFDYNTFSRKPKLYHSKSLKLSTEYDIPTSGNSISFRRNRSLPHLDITEECNDSHFSCNGEEKCARLDAKEDIIYPNMEELSEEIDSQEKLEKNSTEFQISEDLEHVYVDEDCSTIRPGKFENEKHVPKNQRHTDDDFNYVKAILELSGFIDSGFDATWHSSNQPLGSPVFEELEAYWPHEPEDGDIIVCYHHRENLFDLVNEVLVQIYERSFPYYPRALSSKCQIRPVRGNHVLEEVWRMIAGPEAEPSMDSLIGQDFGMDDGWMNLQMESECVGLEIEDFIFDELLEEIVNS